MSGTDLEDSLILLLFYLALTFPLVGIFSAVANIGLLYNQEGAKRVSLARAGVGMRPPKDTPANNPIGPIGHHLG